jgi:hypothetical protein
MTLSASFFLYPSSASKGDILLPWVMMIWGIGLIPLSDPLAIIVEIMYWCFYEK